MTEVERLRDALITMTEVFDPADLEEEDPVEREAWEKAREALAAEPQVCQWKWDKNMWRTSCGLIERRKMPGWEYCHCGNKIEVVE